MTEDAALCARTDPTLWHADYHGHRARAAALCLGCPVLDACRAYRDELLARGERLFGVWGSADYGVNTGYVAATEVAA